MDIARRLRSRAENLEEVAAGVAQNALRHMAAARVSSTQNENFYFLHDVKFNSRRESLLAGNPSLLFQDAASVFGVGKGPFGNIIPQLRNPADTLGFPVAADSLHHGCGKSSTGHTAPPLPVRALS